MTVRDAEAICQSSSWEDNDLLGSWRVLSTKAVIIDADGTKTERESFPEGVIIFTPARRMIAFVTDADRMPANNETEALALFRSMIAYTGQFTLGPGQYTVELEFTSTQIRLEEPQTRLYRVDGDELTIITPEHDSLFDPTKRNSTVLVAAREK